MFGIFSAESFATQIRYIFVRGQHINGLGIHLLQSHIYY
jgi:hypothetical protein